MAGGFHQAGVHGHPLIDDKPPLGELLKNDAVDPVHRLFGQTPPETGKGGMVGGMLIEGQIHELLEGDPVVDLVFQLRFGAVSSSGTSRGRSSMNDPGKNRSYAKVSVHGSLVRMHELVHVESVRVDPPGPVNGMVPEG